jgi:hypothetical protein
MEAIQQQEQKFRSKIEEWGTARTRERYLIRRYKINPDHM